MKQRIHEHAQSDTKDSVLRAIHEQSLPSAVLRDRGQQGIRALCEAGQLENSLSIATIVRDGGFFGEFLLFRENEKIAAVSFAALCKMAFPWADSSIS